ncbi:glycerophosphoryl diester phosphodiesterase [Marininema mesophilum]|uniref:Glycerophosphoryl diester phosphodiesterase n=1 Tax=Marininema mesophilum TaxID=1048340 RepID=A0A1H2XAA6_9BACL|nr:glycerophosphodiester phosphodiesterase [Marininema mesophilum]SDW89823.1 glycerophosphoryl diester phosphodiesterase [Marininema mesophilum]
MSQGNRFITVTMTVITFFILISTVSCANQKNASLIPSSQSNVLVIAHRGASGYAPEHTLPSYNLAKKMKADYLEVDLQRTKDNKLVIIHDETLDRTTTGTGRVKDHTLAEIKNLDAGSWFNNMYPKLADREFAKQKILTLDEILSYYGNGVKYYIETKAPEVYPGMEKELLAMLKAHLLLDKKSLQKRQVIIQSFSADSLKKIHKMNPDIPLVQLLWYTGKGKGQISKKQMNIYDDYAFAVGPNIEKIDAAYVKKVRGHGLAVHPYTLNDPNAIQKTLNWGVDGMFTNYPDRLHDAVFKRSRR